MALARFSYSNSLKKVWFFKQTGLQADTNMKVVLEMFFLAFSNADFQFGTEKLIWRSYIVVEAYLLLV